MDVKCGDIVCLIQMFNNGFHMGYHNKKCGYVNENYAFIYTEKLDNLDHKTKLKRAKVFRDKYLRILILIKFFCYKI